MLDKVLLRGWMFLRRNLWVRRFDEIHVEAVFSEAAFDKLWSYAIAHPQTSLMLSCPLHDDWHRMRIQAERAHEPTYMDTVEERYLKLNSLRNLLGVHVHLFGPYSVEVPQFRRQYRLIRDAKQYFEGLGLPTTDFAAGWNRYNADTIKVCEELGFKRFHVSQVRNGCEKSEKLGFRMVYNVGHDWGLK